MENINNNSNQSVEEQKEIQLSSILENVSIACLIDCFFWQFFCLSCLFELISEIQYEKAENLSTWKQKCIFCIVV